MKKLSFLITEDLLFVAFLSPLVCKILSSRSVENMFALVVEPCLIVQVQPNMEIH